MSYRVRAANGEWLAATLDAGERLKVEYGPLRASLGLSGIYEDTGLAAG